LYIEQTTSNEVTVWNTAEVSRESAFPSIVRQGNFKAAKAAHWVERVKWLPLRMVAAARTVKDHAVLAIVNTVCLHLPEIFYWKHLGGL
jgi:hypothetical protein